MELKYVKEVSLIEFSEYEVANKIDDDQFFAWWMHYIFKKRDRIIAKAKTKYCKITHKYVCLSVGPATETLKLTHYWGVDSLPRA